MVVYFSFLIIPQSIHVGVNEHHDEGIKQVEQQPHINHLHVGGLGKVVANVDEHRSENQHRRNIQRDHGFKEELLEIVGGMTNNVQNYCWANTVKMMLNSRRPR